MLTLSDHSVTMAGILLNCPVGNVRKLYKFTKVGSTNDPVKLETQNILCQDTSSVLRLPSFRVEKVLLHLQQAPLCPECIARRLIIWHCSNNAHVALVCALGGCVAASERKPINTHRCRKHFLHQGLCLYPEFKSGQRNRQRHNQPP